MAQGPQLFGQPLAMVPLNLQRLIFHGAAGTTEPLQVGGQGEERRTGRQTPG